LADAAAVSGHAQSADGSVVFESMPSFTWQFADDAETQRAMVQENQGGLAVGIKACPVLQPMSAERFLRQELLPKVRAGKRAAAVEPPPEFNQWSRERLRLPRGGRRRPSGAHRGCPRAPSTTSLGNLLRNGSPRRRSCAPPRGARQCLRLPRHDAVSVVRAPQGNFVGNDRLFN